MVIYISVIIIPLMIHQSSTRGQTTFAKTYGGSSYDGASSALQTNDSGFIIAGFTYSFGAGNADCLLFKIDVNGNLQWAKTYGDTGYDFANFIQQTSDGGFIIAGSTTSFGAGYEDCLLFKIDVNGNLQWAKTYGDTGYDFANFIQQTSDGGFIVAGVTYSFGAGDFLVIKTDSSGNVQWAKIYGGPRTDVAYFVTQTNDGGFIVAGMSNSFGLSNIYNYLLIKIDINVNILWAKTYENTGGGDFDMFSLQQTSDGGFIIAGGTNSFGVAPYDYDVLLIKVNKDGEIQWAKTYAGMSGQMAHSVIQTSDGGYALVGWTWTFPSGANANQDFLIIKTDTNGNVRWAKTYGGTKEDRSFFVQQTKDNGFIIMGLTESFGEGLWDILLIKTDNNGYIGSCSIVGRPNYDVVLRALNIANPNLLTFSPNISVSRVALNITSQTISVSEICPLTSVPSESSTPLQFKLFQNYPNPFNSTTTIPFWLPQRTNVILKVYDVFGREIATLVNREFDAGEHSIQFNANDLPSGVYFYRLQAGNFIEQKKMIFIK